MRTQLAQPPGILAKQDVDPYDERGLFGLAVSPGFANPALGPDGVTASIPKVISLSTGQ
jgi:hypothetical protein